MSDYYDLDGQPTSFDKWVAMFATADRHVAVTALPGDVLVSTVWLGLDHRFFGDGLPLIFETMIFGLPGEGEYQWRYPNRDAALAGHDQAVALARDAIEVRP